MNQDNFETTKTIIHPTSPLNENFVKSDVNGSDVLSFDYFEKSMAAVQEILNELRRAKGMFPNNFVNQHEAYAVILEEIDELWDEIKKNQRNYDLIAQRKEAVQAATMLLRLLTELL